MSVRVNGMDLPDEEYAFLYQLGQTLPGQPSVARLAAECVHRQLTGNPAAQPRQPGPSVDEVRDARVKELIQAGWTKTRIAVGCHVSVQVVAKARKELGLCKPGRPRVHPEKTAVGPYKNTDEGNAT